MVSTLNLEIQLQELFKQREYSKIIFEITSKTSEEERSSSICNLLGICRIESNRKDKDSLLLAFLTEKSSGKTSLPINFASLSLSKACNG